MLGKRDTFITRRNAGEYDSGFAGMVAVEKNRGR